MASVFSSIIEVMPDDVVEKVRAEEIPIDAIMADLQQQGELYPRPIFSLSARGSPVPSASARKSLS